MPDDCSPLRAATLPRAHRAILRAPGVLGQADIVELLAGLDGGSVLYVALGANAASVPVAASAAAAVAASKQRQGCNHARKYQRLSQ